MFENEFLMPLNILKDKAILERIQPHHPRRVIIESNLGQAQAGFKGEKSVRYYLNLLNEPQLKILYAIRLLRKPSAFQMDYLLITPKVIIILEVKNLSGTIIVGDPFHQCIRITEDGEKERLKDPLTQVQIQRNQLKNWLQKYFSYSVPIEYLIVNTHPKAIINVEDPNSEYVEKFFTEERLLHKIHDVIASYTKNSLTPKQTAQLISLLKQKSTELNNTPLTNYNIHPNEVVKGVLCPQCKVASMMKEHTKWVCAKCKLVHSHAYQQALKDYFLIFNKPISNMECRKWLNIESRHVAQRLLKGSDLKVTGDRKGAVYIPQDNSFYRK